MFDMLVNPEEALRILSLGDRSELDRAINNGELPEQHEGGVPGKRFRIGDVVMFELTKAIRCLGVDGAKSVRYAQAVLGSRLAENDENVLDWIENESQDLFCLIADSQLARIFLRDKEGAKEVDVGAVKPVLFPTTKCEINVFRVIRPAVFRARQLLNSR